MLQYIVGCDLVGKFEHSKVKKKDEYTAPPHAFWEAPMSSKLHSVGTLAVFTFDYQIIEASELALVIRYLQNSTIWAIH